ncbi:energy-coupling factor transporter transmembrane protein EcfT [Candidatus Thorarchaeota archaeon]|nr:MAG: energy-coupling factor transporter transmembrane protein EcfT [Candidatus Thorarchaeota archaeon]
MVSNVSSNPNVNEEPRLNPLLKLFLLIVTLTGIIIYPSWKLSLILLIFLLFLFKISQVTLTLSHRRTKFIIFFSVILLLFQVIVTANGTILGFLVPQINTFGPYLPVTDYGVERGLSITFRFLLIILSSMLFVSVTDPTLLAHSLTKLRLSYRYTFALVIALRFLPLFESENQIVRQAQRSRGIQPEVGSLKKIFRTIQYTFFPLLVSSLSRVESLSMSMDGRGFGYHQTRTYLRKSTWRVVDTAAVLVATVFVILCIALAAGFIPQISNII